MSSDDLLVLAIRVVGVELPEYEGDPTARKWGAIDALIRPFALRVRAVSRETVRPYLGRILLKDHEVRREAPSLVGALLPFQFEREDELAVIKDVHDGAVDAGPSIELLSWAGAVSPESVALYKKQLDSTHQSAVVSGLRGLRRAMALSVVNGATVDVARFLSSDSPHIVSEAVRLYLGTRVGAVRHDELDAMLKLVGASRTELAAPETAITLLERGIASNIDERARWLDLALRCDSDLISIAILMLLGEVRLSTEFTPSIPMGGPVEVRDVVMLLGMAVQLERDGERTRRHLILGSLKRNGVVARIGGEDVPLRQARLW